MPKITPFLWFNTEAEEAAKLYASIFKNSKITATTYYPKDAKVPGGKPADVMTVAFELDGSPFVALNGGPIFTFTEAVSFVVDCKDQAEIDYFWEKLTADGGRPSQCGWLKDKFGVSWQIVPTNMEEIMGSNPRAFAAMMQMTKLDIDALRNA